MSHHKNILQTTMKIESSVTDARYEMMKILGMSMSEQIQTFHICPICKRQVSSLIGFDERPDIRQIAEILKNSPSRIVGEDELCECKMAKAILVKLVYSATLPSKNWDMHCYFEYDTPISKYEVYIITLDQNKQLGKISDNDRRNLLGF